MLRKTGLMTNSILLPVNENNKVRTWYMEKEKLRNLRTNVQGPPVNTQSAAVRNSVTKMAFDCPCT